MFCIHFIKALDHIFYWLISTISLLCCRGEHAITLFITYSQLLLLQPFARVIKQVNSGGYCLISVSI